MSSTYTHQLDDDGGDGDDNGGDLFSCVCVPFDPALFCKTMPLKNDQ